MTEDTGRGAGALGVPPLDLGELPVPSEALVQKARQKIRVRMRSLRGAHPESLLEAKSRRVVERLWALDPYRTARAIALFYPMPSEVDLRGLDRDARSQGKRVYYPFLEARGAAVVGGFAEVSELSELGEQGHRFLEPPASAPRATSGDLDLVIVPALAVSENGHRLGYGSGFYDLTLPDFCPPAQSIVVAFEFQLLAELPVLAHDVACDVVLTDSRTLTRARRP